MRFSWQARRSDNFEFALPRAQRSDNFEFAFLDALSALAIWNLAFLARAAPRKF